MADDGTPTNNPIDVRTMDPAEVRARTALSFYQENLLIDEIIDFEVPVAERLKEYVEEYLKRGLAEKITPEMWLKRRSTTRRNITNRLRRLAETMKATIIEAEDLYAQYTEIAKLLWLETIYTKVIETLSTASVIEDDRINRARRYEDEASTLNEAKEFLRASNRELPTLFGNVPITPAAQPLRYRSDLETVKKTLHFADDMTPGGALEDIKPVKKELDSPSPSLAEDTEIRQMVRGHQIFSYDTGHKEELPTFSGRYEDWDSFNEQFEALVDSNPKLSPIIKLKRLISALKGEAQRAVREYSFKAENYELIKDKLRIRFGNNTLIFHEVVRRVQRHAAITEANIPLFRDYVDLVSQMIHHTSIFEPGFEQFPGVIMMVIQEKLPYTCNRVWENKKETYREAHGISIPRNKILRSFLSFLNNYIEQSKSALLLDPNYRHRVSLISDKDERPSTAGSRQGKSVYKRAGRASRSLDNFATQASVSNRAINNPVPTQPKKEAGRVSSCCYCQQNHHPKQCRNNRRSKEESARTVMQSRLCLNCLSPGHFNRFCTEKKCGVNGCNQKHHQSLHGARSASAAPNRRQ